MTGKGKDVIDITRRKAQPTWIPPKDLDKECLDLCLAMNNIKGIETTNSCCGHGKHQYCIFFQVEDIGDTLPLLYFIDQYHTKLVGRWSVRIYTDCAGDMVRFVLEGPTGPKGYADSKRIAEQLSKHSA